jgi:nucleoside 2-deoxyribosyltransferase
VHATFRWKHRIIPGIAYADMLGLSPSGLLNVVDDLASVYDANHRNPKWRDGGAPSYIETQAWMMEEELVTEVLADVVDRPMFLVARNHHVTNLADLFVTTKKRVYLSYPITAIRTAEPELLQQIQGPILTELESLFVVFDPLAIRDMTLATTNPAPDELDERAISLIKARTVERDFQFIEQCDAVVVAYMTEKLSPGVIAEMQMAHRTQKPIFLAFPGPRSPFLEEVAAVIEPDVESLMPHLRAWAEGGRV